MTSSIHLKNGGIASEEKILEIVTNVTLLVKKSPVAFLELVQKCHDESYHIETSCHDFVMREWSSFRLVDENGNLANSVKDIVVSSIQMKREPNGSPLTIVDPRKVDYIVIQID